MPRGQPNRDFSSGTVPWYARFMSQSNRPELAKLDETNEKALQGDPKRIDKQHEAGKLTARERVDLL